MQQFEFLIKVISVLNKCNIHYMLTGSIVSSIQGEPRSTHDIDFVINTDDINRIKKITKFFMGPDFYLDESSIDDAIKNKSMFNLIDTINGEKADFWILTDSGFDISRFSRKTTINIEGYDLFISTPEDTIIAKLTWSKLSGGSKKQLIDALRIYEVQGELLDENYIRLWAEKLNIESLWKNIKRGIIQ